MVRRRGAARAAPPLPSLLDPELPSKLEALGFPGKNAWRIWRYLYANPRAADVSEMRDLPQALRAQLCKEFCTSTARVRTELRSADGTVKLLVQLHDGLEIESVVINQGGEGEFAKSNRRRMKASATLCVSSQVGCRMGCKFCATGTLGLDGNLAACEILEQLRLARTVRDDVRHIVFMGMGEPLDNFDAVVSVVKLMTEHAQLLELGARPVTVSTVGPTPQAIRRLVELGLPGHARLAVSLHAPTQSLREEIVPSARGSPLKDLMTQIDEYYDATKEVSRKARNEKVLIEYCLLSGVNDSEECAAELAELLSSRLDSVHLNIIPYNSVSGSGFGAPSADTIQRFYEVVYYKGVKAHVRKQLGNDIAAACGQLARESCNSLDIEDAQSAVVHGPARSGEVSSGCRSKELDLPVRFSLANFQAMWLAGGMTCIALVATAFALQVFARPRRDSSAIWRAAMAGPWRMAIAQL